MTDLMPRAIFIAVQVALAQITHGQDFRYRWMFSARHGLTLQSRRGP